MKFLKFNWNKNNKIKLLPSIEYPIHKYKIIYEYKTNKFINCNKDICLKFLSKKLENLN